MNLTTTYSVYHFPCAGILRCATIPPGQGCILIAYQDIEAFEENRGAGNPPPGDSRSIQGTAFTFTLPRGGYWWLKLDRIPVPVTGATPSVKWEFIPTGDAEEETGGYFGPDSNLMDSGHSGAGDAMVTVPPHVVPGDQVLLFGLSRQAKYRYWEIKTGAGLLCVRYGALPLIAAIDGAGNNHFRGYTTAAGFRAFENMFGPALFRGEIWATSSSGVIEVYTYEGG